jgi:hypothetical protein
MAPTRNARIAGSRRDSGVASKISPVSGRDGRADPAPFAGRRLPDPFEDQNMTEAAIMDKSGNTPPNIGQLSQIG